ncbi:MAG: TraB/GumN family protein [Alphaproteobacteria bacterium]
MYFTKLSFNYLAVIGVVVFSLGANASNDDANSNHVAPVKVKKHGMYFEAVGPKGEVRRFVPTNHVAKLYDVFEYSEVQEIEDDAKKKICLESSFSFEENQRQIDEVLSEDFLMANNAFLGDDEPFWQINDDEINQKFDRVFNTLSEWYPHLKEYKRLKPAFAYAIFCKSELNSVASSQTDPGMDIHLYVNIGYENKSNPVKSLEDMKDLLFAANLHEKTLEDVISDLNPLQEECSTDYIYDLDELESLELKFPGEIFGHDWVVRRNVNWLPKIISPDMDGYLIVVGMGHFVGKGGLINMMRKLGWTWYQLLPRRELITYEPKLG